MATVSNWRWVRITLMSSRGARIARRLARLRVVIPRRANLATGACQLVAELPRPTCDPRVEAQDRAKLDLG
eukprot:1229357-Prymnesium_polylepis.2